ncbi:MAG: DNA translocase FtsK 4TM domain-containing protein [Paracoccaceae bacterium]|nr:DNA translocase FtsK 4TM domain-containing protein [Paracoccaceae bacterium]
MASYQIRQRDPILDQNTQAIIERRGKELFGMALIVLAVLGAAMLVSYSPKDPGWMSDTHSASHNLLGTLGAMIASPLMVIAGRGAWGIPAILFLWGARFLTHRGEERAINRVIFIPIAIALGSISASTHTPTADWGHAFGMGGLFGDTVLGTLVMMMPFGLALSLKLLSVIVGVTFIAMFLFVTGFDRNELRAIALFLLVGTLRTYDWLIRKGASGAAGSYRMARQGATGSAQIAQRLRARQAARRDADTADWDEPAADLRPQPLSARNPALRAQPYEPIEPMVQRGAPQPAAPLPPQQPAPRASFLSRVPGFRRSPDPLPELVEPDFPDHFDGEAPSADRIRARIAHAIQTRAQGEPPVQPSSRVLHDEPAPRFRAKPLVAEPRQPQARVEPPVTRHAPAAAQLPPEPMVSAQAYAAPDAFDEYDVDPLDDPYAEYDDPAVTEPPRFLPQAGAPKRVVQPAVRKPAAPSRQAQTEAQPSLRFDDHAPAAYENPPLSLLTNPADVERHYLPQDALEENARMLETVLDDYGVKGEIVAVHPGPVVTQYELEPAPGLKASRVIGLADDIARSMSALSARVSTVPGRSVIGIELPNATREKVVLREILSSRDFGDSNMKLPLALGKDIGGRPVVANLAKMPHLLIAGTTGSGKSVAINTMILSLLYRLSPEECRLIMIDPKMLELSVYDGIPHLLSPVVTDPKKAVVALKWVVGEMEERYRKMSKMGVRNIEGFNGRVKEALAKGEMFKRTIQTGFDEDTGDPIFETEEFAPVPIPYIVVIVDEMADLMMVAGKEIEACIQRLAQMARASGIHLIMATQRPSVDVITGTIKANFPTRISFQVTSKIDSRTILGEQGAEQLLGMGDMLYMAGGARITRVHGPFVSDEEVEEIVTHLKSFGPPEYMSGVVDGPDEEKADDIDLVLGLGGNTDGDDALYDQAVAVVLKDRKCSTSYIQRKLGIGYNKAARLVEQMEEQGLVTPANHVGKREILVPEQ